jgi:hypothetical protein
MRAKSRHVAYIICNIYNSVCIVYIEYISYICVCVCMYVCIKYISYIFIHIHIYTYMYIYICGGSFMRATSRHDARANTFA